ncbi:MFS transporter [uncultured Tolumonas sp.]|uniref:MFS transporter n=1 Tax=uncultured Tolumonas sp. TaxID=263765 RepID=UPI002A0A8F3A|nr:MFS transporter [uncultured Tolumonas sp.]
MTVIQTTNQSELATADVKALPAALTTFFAAGAGFSVATIYYSQPLLGMLTEQWQAPAQQIGWIPSLTQLGYALGILFLAPLGDRYDRRRIILTKSSLLMLALLGAAAAGGLISLLVASLCIGLMATMAQDIVPAAATLAPEASRGKVVGSVMTGLLLGILLSRVLSGLIADWLGWRSMFVLAALTLLGIWLAAWRMLPRFQATSTLPYHQLLASLFHLWRQYAALRQASLVQGLLSLSFSAFWSTLAVMLHGAPFHLGSAAAGLFGLAGAAGALMAPVAGKQADRIGPVRVAMCGAALVVFFFLMMAGMALAATSVTLQLVVLAVGTVGFDMGVQISLIANQTLVYSLEPAARSRLNALLLVMMFVGMTLGSVLGNLMLAHFGWVGVTGLATLSAMMALVLRMQK